MSDIRDIPCTSYRQKTKIDIPQNAENIRKIIKYVPKICMYVICI